MQCAAGTRCVPDGRTYDFRIQATGNNGGSGAQYATAKAARSLRVGWPGSGGAWNAPGGAGAWEERVGRVSFLVGVAAFVAWWGMA